MSGRRGQRPDGKFFDRLESAASKADRLDTAIQRVERLQDDGTRSLQVTVPQELHQALRVEAATSDITLKEHVTGILMRALGQDQSQKPHQQADKRILTIQVSNRLFKALKTNAITAETSLSDFIIKALEKGKPENR